MSILLYDQQQLMGCISEVERIETKVNSKKKVVEEKRRKKQKRSTYHLR